MFLPLRLAFFHLACGGGPEGSQDPDGDKDGVVAQTDCDDEDPAVLGPSLWHADADGDGYGDPLASLRACAAPADHVDDASDCDDTDPEVRPGALERCNGEDDDCDGETDEYDEDREPTGYLDLDGDGYGDEQEPTRDCELPAGFASSGQDCDTADPSIHPGAPERCDGLDNDCDGETDEAPDGDEDGFIASDCGGDDCDDADDAVHPAADEICDNGVDDDCDGSAGTCGVTGQQSLADADAWFRGQNNGDRAGFALAGAGDVDADGHDDLLIGAPGHAGSGVAYLLRDPLNSASSLAKAGHRLLGEALDDGAGSAVAGVGDVNGNNYADLLVGAPGQGDRGGEAGAAYLVQGPLDGDLALERATACLMGEAAQDFAGSAVAGAGDVDADGYDDILIGAYGSGESFAGVAYLLYCPVVGTISLDAADARLVGESSSYTSASLAGAGDMDGDGYGDIAIGAPGRALDPGAAYLVLGPVSGELELADADAVLFGEAASDHAGQSVAGAGDLDGDGYCELLVGADKNDTGADDAGAVYVLHGPIAGPRGLGEADAKLVGSEPSGQAGYALDACGDVDADGLGDVLIGAPYGGGGGEEAGAAFLVLGPFSGVRSLETAEASIQGEDAHGYAGAAVAGAGDVDGDGSQDLLVGAYGAEAGGAWLWLGGGM